MRLSVLAAGLLMAAGQVALAAPPTTIQDPTNVNRNMTVNSDGSINVTGSFSGTISGFTPGGTTANLSVTGTSADVALPAGTVVKVVNWGATDVHFRVTVGAGTAVTTDEVLKAGAATGVTVGSNTHLSAITDTGTSTLSLAGGTGLVSGYGGGGSGGGGVVTQPTAANLNATVVGTGTFATQSAQSGTWTVQPGNTANTTAWKVDGSAVTQPVSGSVSLTGATNNINNIAGTVSLPTGAATSANQSTEIGSLATIATNSGSSVPAGTNAIGTVQPGTTPACGSVIPISQTASTDLHTASGKTYICSMLLVVPDAEVVSLVEGTGSVCATGTAALVGATTAANGMSFAANGGVFSGGGGFIWLPMQTTSDHLCLLQSGSGRIAGVITYNDH